jgi:hypothetical protein
VQLEGEDDVIRPWAAGLSGNLPTPPSAAEARAAPSLQHTRERVLGVSLRWISLGLLPILGVMLAQSIWDDVPLSPVLWLLAFTSPVPVLFWARQRLGYARTTKLFLLVVVAIVLYLESVRGFTPAAALLNNSLVLLSTLLFGPKVFRWVLLLCLANLVLGWLLYSGGFAAPEGWTLSDPGRPLVWVRHALVLTFLGGAVREMSRDVHALENEKLLNEIGGVLASSLDVQQTLGEVSRRAVQTFADLCVIELMDGEAEHVHVTARAPERAWLADALRALPLERDTPRIDDVARRTRQPQLVKVTHDYLKNHSQGAAHLALLEAMEARSIASAPMITHDRVSGVLTAVSSTSIYDEQDLQVLAQIAERAAMAIENASLHAALHQANAEMSARLEELQAAQARIRTLTGFLPVCAWCGRIRDDSQGGQWRRLEQYVTDHTSAGVTHSICPECTARQLT